VDALFNSTFALVCLGAGLAVLCGLRAFLPLAIVGLVARTDVFGPLHLGGTHFAFLCNSWVIVALFVLALVEITADKVPLLDSAQDLVATPLRIAAGAVAFGAALAGHHVAVVVVALVAGTLVAGVSQGVKGFIRPGATAVSGGVANPFLSFFEDLAALFGTILVLLVPFLGILLVAFLLYLVFRLRQRRRRKYRGLRILKDD
jgi:uncharacterized membrane protein